MSLNKYRIPSLKDKYFKDEPEKAENKDKKAVKPAKVKVEKPKVKKKKR